MSISVQILVIFLCLIVSFLYFRGFLYGIKRYQLNNSAYKKRKKGESFKEWLVYSRYKKEIPKVLLILYYSVLLIHLASLVLCVFFYAINQFPVVGEMLIKIIVCFDAAWIIFIAVLFWSPGRDFKYKRWINKTDKLRTEDKRKK